ncbi:MAG: BACON domain-containing protein, partial [Odoribacter sp.]|nr:BACON domain-containing protein [Odoribacter sp.]
MDDPDNPKNITLEISTNDLVFNAQGEEKDFTIYCNGNWTIVNESSWCKTDVTQGNGDVRVSVSVEPYVETQDRNTNLVIKAGDRTEVLTVTQKPGDAIILSKDKFNFEQAGGNITIEVTSNIDYQVWIPAECRSWIVPVPESRAVTTKNFCFVVAENEGLDQRNGYIIFFGGYGLEDTVYVYQAQKDQFVFVKNTYEIPRKGQEVAVELKTNVEYDVVIPNDVASWIHLITTRASRTDRLNFQIDENPGIDMRTANVVVKDKNSNLSDTIKFIQNGEKAIYIGDVVFSKEQDLIDFYDAGYTKVQGNVTVYGLKTLQRLGNRLTEITDSLILNSGDLTSLEGLSDLTKIGGSLHAYKGKISSFEGLDNLETISGNFTLSSSFDALKSFKGLGNLKSIGGNFESSLSRYYSSFGALESFEGLENLESIGGNFTLVSSFDALKSFKGLGNLKSIGGNFESS